MLPEGVLPAERLVTHGTLERLFARVYPLVSAKGKPGAERLAAVVKVTDEGALSRVDARVAAQGRALLVRLAAPLDWTFVQAVFNRVLLVGCRIRRCIRMHTHAFARIRTHTHASNRFISIRAGTRWPYYSSKP